VAWHPANIANAAIDDFNLVAKPKRISRDEDERNGSRSFWRQKLSKTWLTYERPRRFADAGVRSIVNTPTNTHVGATTDHHPPCPIREMQMLTMASSKRATKNPRRDRDDRSHALPAAGQPSSSHCCRHARVMTTQNTAPNP